MDKNNDYYEIEYGSSSIPGVGKFVLNPQKIEQPKKDEIRELFGRMREIARVHSITSNYSFYYNYNINKDNSIIFYKQAKFMENFSDNYTEFKPFSGYFPFYQMLGYEQLRTYFTWRTKVREGHVSETSISYAFLYIYELLNNIGVIDPLDGLEKLMFFWKNFSVYTNIVDKYIIKWLKDYHIYYELPHSFKEFIDTNNLSSNYPDIIDTTNNFELYCSISRYSAEKSPFLKVDDNENLYRECLLAVVEKIKLNFMSSGISFESILLKPTKKLTSWLPFKDAIFYHWAKQSDRQVMLYNNEIYTCTQNIWFYSKNAGSLWGKNLMLYIMKQVESHLRKVTNYKKQINHNIPDLEIFNELKKKGISLDILIEDYVKEFYREKTKTVINLDNHALNKIRQEAISIQEKLIVPEHVSEILIDTEKLENTNNIEPSQTTENNSDTCLTFKNALTDNEKSALILLLQGNLEVKKFADNKGIMLEVLIDGINEKAMDFIGDNILDDEFNIYEEYLYIAKELVE